MLRWIIALAALPAIAQPTVLTFTDALERARQTTPVIAPGRVAGSFLDNPSIEVEAGRRDGETSSTDYGIEVAQEIELPRRRHARIDAAQAILMQEEQRARETERAVLRDVATTFLRALEARERADAATSAKRLADEAMRIAERRYAAGDVAQLDVNLARSAVARADADERTAKAMLTGHLTRLQILLDITQTIEIRGSLRDPLVQGEIVAADRPDLRALDAEIAEAEAEQRLAKAMRVPDLGLRASYRSEEHDRILLGGVGITLPFFNRGQETASIAGARLARLRMQRDTLARSIDAEVRGARASYEALRDAATNFETSVLPLIEENERLALESYDVGQIGLADLLLVRREALDAHRAFIDQLIETRLAEVELRAAAGVWK